MMNINYRSVLLAGAMLTAGCFSAQAALPEPLYNGPVNYTGSAPGSYSYNADTGAMTIHGCGSDIWGTSDSFYYVYTTLEEDTDFDYVVKATDLQGNSGDDGWTKAGLMVRASVGYTYNSETGEVNGLDMVGGARYFCVQTLRTSGSYTTKWIIQWRPENDLSVTDDYSKRYGNYTWPQWLRLRKIGTTYYGIVSSDGVNWEKLWSEDSSTWSEGPLAPVKGTTPLAIGVYVTSHNPNSNDSALTAYDFQAFPQTPVEFVNELNGADITAAQSYTFSATVSGYSPYNYVWKKDGKVIAQGTELVNNTFTYKVETAQLSDSGTYSLEVTNTANGQTTTKTSSAQLTVVAETTDVNPPEILSAQAIENTVGITFNEAVDTASATQPANYTVTGKTVTEVVQRTSDRVTLILNSKVNTGASVNVTVKNVADLSGNKITEATATATADFSLSVTGQPFTPGYAEAMGGDGFFINNQGLVNWGNYDEDTFVYKTFTGDFDMRIRVLDHSYTTPSGRAGLQIRTALDDGKAAPHSAYMEIYHCPMKIRDWSDSLGGYTEPYDNIRGAEMDDYRFAIDSNYRPTTGGDTGHSGYILSFVVDGNRTTPGNFYLNGGEMWLRIGRVGKVINAYYGIKTGGQIDWTRINSRTLNDLGTVAYGGPHYAVEGVNFGATDGLTNEFKNPTTYFFMSAANYEEGYLEPVELLRSPVSKSIKAPAPFSLTVTATGDPLTYQWYKDGKPIEGAIFATYSVDLSTVADSGAYYCEVMNFGSGAPDKGTSVISEIATVTVEEDTTTVLEIVSQPPAMVTAYENGAVSLPVEVNYSTAQGDVAPTYTWYMKNDILTSGAWMPVSSVTFTEPASVSGANTSTLQFRNLQGWEHGGVYRLDMVLLGKTLSSQEITLNVISDFETPTAMVKGNNTMENITVEFSETVYGLDDPSNYIISGLTVLAASCNESMDVAFLRTTRQEEGKVYDVKFQNIYDNAGNTIPSNYSASFTSFVWAPGYTLLECFDGTSYFVDLFDTIYWTPGLNAYRLPPQGGQYIEITSSTFNQDYCTERVSGYIVPKETGTYEFAGSCDDDFKLWISPTESIYDMSDNVVCWEESWNSNGERVYDWNGASGTYGTTPIDLQAGQKYFFTVALREAGGGDFVSLTWRLLPNAMQANKTAPILTGDLLGVYIDGDACELTITGQPEDVTGKAGDSVAVSVEATTDNPLNAPISYQWYLNGQPVEGATAATMTFTLTPEMNGALSYCELRIPSKIVKSYEAMITVEAASEQVYPMAVSGAGDTIFVAFDKPVDPESATTIANYTVAGAIVESAVMQANSENMVELKVSGELSNIIVVTVDGVKNLSGLPMSAPVTLEGAYMDFAVLNPSGIDPYVTVDTDGKYTLHAGGGDYWNATEVGCPYLYEAVEGDFDVVLCVEGIEYNNQWSKVGLAFRSTLDANSAHFSMLATPLRVQATYRPTAGAASVDATARNYDGVTFPSNWIRVKREGDQFTAYRSLDGNYWTYVGGVTGSQAQLPAAGYIGIVYSTQDLSNYHTAVVSGYDSQYVAPALPTPDPSDYTFTMVGYQAGGAEGFYDYDAETGMFSVWGCGADVWGTNDHFSYLYRPVVAGDFSLTVKLNDFPASSSGWAKAGLMVREGDADGGFPVDSRYISMNSLRAYNSNFGNFRYAWRPTIGLNVDDAHSMSGSPYSYPCWMRLSREGNAICSYISYDGINWEQYLEIYTGEWPNGDLGAKLPLYVGMFVSSVNVQSSDDCAYFSDVTFVGDDVPPPVTDLVLSYDFDGENLTLRWEAASGASLEVAPTADSANWTILEGELVGGTYQCVVPVSEAAGYYRLTR